MTRNELNKLSRIEKFLYFRRRKLAEKAYIKREIKKELYEIKYDKEKPEYKPWSWSKWLCFGITFISVIVIFFSMYATILLNDSQMMVALIGGLITLLGSVVAYTLKATRENIEGGIVFETTMAELQKDNKDAQG